MAQQSVRRGRKNQGFPECLAARLGDVDLVRELPYRLAALIIAAPEAGQMAASDNRVRHFQKLLAPKGASTDGKLPLPEESAGMNLIGNAPHPKIRARLSRGGKSRWGDWNMGNNCCGVTRRNYLKGGAGAIVAATSLGSASLLGNATEASASPAASAPKYRCPPCGLPCDKLVFDKPGSCPKCGMTLIPLDEHGVTKVAVLVFDGAEIIDFAGPWEVFGTAGFVMHTVAPKLEPLTMVFGQKLIPDYTFETSPPANVLLIPGGGVFDYLADDRMIGWIREQSRNVDHVISVCTGAYFLQKAGLLAGQTVTATNGMIEDFATADTRVVYDRRYVDNGKILTTAGLSSGIDGAIHLVSRMRGLGFAQSVALELEYPWDPDDKWARADLADRYLPSKLLSRRGEVNGAKFGILSTKGSADQWEARLLFSAPVTNAAVIDVLRREIADNKAKGGMFKSVSHIQRAPAFGADASNSRLSWSFTDDQGRAWKGLASVTPGKNASSGIVAILNLRRQTGS